MPRRVLEVVRFHEGQAVAVEHEPDVDEEHAVARAAVEKFLFEQFADAALIGAVADAIVAGHVLVQLDFVLAGIHPHFLVDQLKHLNPSLGKSGCLLDAIEKHLDEARGIDFLFPPKAHPAESFEFAGAVVHDDRALASRHIDPPRARGETGGCWNAGIRPVDGKPSFGGDQIAYHLWILSIIRHFLLRSCRFTVTTLAQYRQNRKPFLSVSRPILTVHRQKLSFRIQEFQTVKGFPFLIHKYQAYLRTAAARPSTLAEVVRGFALQYEGVR